ncbi:MAG: hypothetical protein HZB29_11730 [Nitrospinae bacterium]|nr:hypothetical protein [Nitrospinota bacterium]
MVLAKKRSSTAPTGAFIRRFAETGRFMPSPSIEPGVERKRSIEKKSKKPFSGASLVAGLKASGFIGMWEDRKDIKSSSAYARKLRDKAERRHKIN